MRVQLHLLGRAHIRLDGESLELPFGKASALLAYLAYQQDWVPRSDIRYLFWADREEHKASNNLRQLLKSLGNLTYIHNLERHNGRLRWSVTTDLQAFWSAVEDKNWAAAVSSYEGELLSGFRLQQAAEFENWLEFERESLARQWRSAVMQLCDALERSQRHDQIAPLLDRLLDTDPYDEDIVQRSMKLAYAQRETARALKTYQHFRERLRRDLGEEPSQTTIVLAEHIRSGQLINDGGQVAIRISGSKRLRLPRQMSPFIGREKEQRDLQHRLLQPDVQLLSIIAPGGMGKTRLALAVAERLDAQFPDGVVFISFAAITDPQQMLSTLATGLEFSFYGQDDPKTQLLSYLSQKEMLLVLDNLEHLVHDNSLIVDLLRHCPKLKLLVTSRERLNLNSEWVYDLGGLHYPNDAASNLHSYDAVAFFLYTARHPQLSHDVFESKDVVQLCRLVQGMPLALLLAAAWLRVLPLKDILTELSKGLELLQSDALDLPERHRSMESVFDTTWQRLSKSDRLAWAKLSVFEGGFNREAAQTVTSVSLLQLLNLINKALITRQGERFYQHPLIQQYGRKQLINLGLATEVQDNHAHYYLSGLKALENDLFSPKKPAAIALMQSEESNILMAWRWAATHARAKVLEGALRPLSLLLEFMTRWDELCDLLSQAESYLPRTSLTRARLQLERARRLNGYALRDLELAKQLANESLAVFSTRGYFAIEDKAYALHALGNTAFLQLNVELAEQHWRKACSLFRECGSDLGYAGINQNLGILYMNTARFDEAEDCFRESTEHFKGIGHLQGYDDALHNWVLLEYRRGNFSKALHMAEESLELERMFQQPVRMAERLDGLANMLKIVGRLQEAKSYYLEQISVVQGLNDRIKSQRTAMATRGLGCIAWLQGDYAEGRRMLSETKAIELCRLVLEEGLLDEAASLCESFLNGIEPYSTISPIGRGYVYACFAEVTLAENNLKLGFEHLNAALEYTVKQKVMPNILRVLPGWAEYLYRTSCPALAEQAVSLALKHKGSDFETRCTALRLVKRFPDLMTHQPMVDLFAFIPKLLTSV